MNPVTSILEYNLEQIQDRQSFLFRCRTNILTEIRKYEENLHSNDSTVVQYAIKKIPVLERELEILADEIGENRQEIEEIQNKIKNV